MSGENQKPTTDAYRKNWQAIWGTRPLAGNTSCPKIGAAQWSCRAAECTCHLKGAAQLREMNEEVRAVALGLEPLASCYPYCVFCKRRHPGGDTCMGHHP